jgi:hypothetical protein
VLQIRLDTAEALADFKRRLAGDFARRPYPGAELRTRTNSTLMGELSKATDEGLHFATQYGEFVHAWADFAPGELAKLGVHYAAAFSATEDAATQARRWFGLAVFARQYGLEKATDAYRQKAVRLQPGIEAPLDRLLNR